MNTSNSVTSEQPGSFQRAMFYLLLLQLILIPLPVLAIMLVPVNEEGAAAVISNVFMPLFFAQLIFVGLALGSKAARKTCTLPIRSAWLVLVNFLLSTVVTFGIIAESEILAVGGIIALLGIVPALFVSLIADMRAHEKVDTFVHKDISLQGERFVVFRRIMYRAVFVSAFIAPLWIGLGRGLFGVGGWGVIFTVPIMMPIAFAYHFLVLMTVGENKKSRATRLVSVHAAIAFAVYLLVVIMFEISLVDGGDTSESINSVLTMMSNQMVSRDVSGVIAYACLHLLPITGLIALILFIIDRKLRAAAPSHSNLPPEVARRLAEVKNVDEIKE